MPDLHAHHRSSSPPPSGPADDLSSPSRSKASPARHTLLLASFGLLGLNLVLASWMHSAPNPTIEPINLQSQTLQSQTSPSETDSHANTYQECSITLLSGRTITGELVRQSDGFVTVLINDIETTFQRNDIARFKVLPPVAERFAQMRSAVSDNDLDARIALVEWLRARKAYDLAIKELDSILLEFPSDERARLLRSWLIEYNKMESKASSKSTASTRKGGSKASARDRRAILQRSQITPLTDEQINLMRVYEIDLRNPPKIRVPDEVMLKLMADNPESFPVDEQDRKAILKLPEIEKLKIIFSHKARDLYAQVEVLDDPQSIKIFKDRVHSRKGWLINTCASTRCHGGVEAGDFQLINTNINSNATTYTNLYLLEQYTLADGSKLINYQDPRRSPLLQMAMIEKNSLHPHPIIPKDFLGPKFRPLFRTTRDRKFKQAIEWINSMYQPRPELNFPSPAHPETEPKPAQP